MVDHFAIFVTHFVIALALWRILSRPDLDNEPWMTSAQIAPKQEQDTQRRA
jgi:hypothetical protein